MSCRATRDRTRAGRLQKGKEDAEGNLIECCGESEAECGGVDGAAPFGWLSRSWSCGRAVGEPGSIGVHATLLVAKEGPATGDAEERGIAKERSASLERSGYVFDAADNVREAGDVPVSWRSHVEFCFLIKNLFYPSLSRTRQLTMLIANQ